MSNTFVNLLFKAVGAKKVKTDVAAIGVVAKTANVAVTGLKSNLAILAAGFGLLKAISIVADFGQEMATVKAITGATGDEFDMLRKKAKDLGAETRFSAGQAAEAMKYLGQAGFDTGAIMESVEGTLRLAQAGALDLGSAADIASNVLTGFGLSTDQTGRVVDVLAKAASSANTNVQQLGEALKFAAPVAAGLGVSLEETTAAIGALSDAGIQGSMAGTGLRLIMAKMTSVTPNATKALAEMGLTVEQINPRIVGFTGAIEALAGKGGTIEDMFDIFQIRGGPAAEILKNNTLKLNDLSDALVNAKGTAANMAEIMDATLKGAALRLFSAMSDLVISLADLGGESLLTKGLDKMATAILLVSRNLEDMGKLIIVLIPLMAALFGGGMVNSIKLMGGAVIKLGMKMKIAFAPLLSLAIIPALIVTLIAGIVLFREKIELFKGSSATVADLFTVIGNRLLRWKSMFAEMIISMKDWVDNAAQGTGIIGILFRNVQLVWKELQLFINNFEIADIARGVAQVIDVMIGSFQGMYAAITIASSGFLAAYLNLWKGGVNLIVGVINKIGEGVASALNLLPGFKVEFNSLEKFILDPEEGFASLGGKIASAIGSGIMNQTSTQDALEGLFDDVKDVAKARELREAGEAITANITEPVKKALEYTDAMRQAWGKIGVVLSDIDFTGFKEFASLRAGEAEFGRLIKNQERQLQLRKALTVEESVALELGFLRQDLEADGLTVSDETIKRYQDLIIATEKANLGFARGAKEGLQDYKLALEDIGSASFELVTGAFQGMEDAIVDFVQTGKFEFRSLIDDMIAQLIRLAIQQTIMKGILGIFGGGFSQGAAFGGSGVIPFAQGGVVNSPTIFPFANGGKVGIMGEAGSEAIMPLTRMPDGNLGIQAQVGSGGGTAVFAPSIVVNVESNGTPQEGQQAGDAAVRAIDRMIESKMVEFTRKMKRPGNPLNPQVQF